jgi:hypothetical protein
MNTCVAAQFSSSAHGATASSRCSDESSINDAASTPSSSPEDISTFIPRDLFDQAPEEVDRLLEEFATIGMDHPTFCSASPPSFQPPCFQDLINERRDAASITMSPEACVEANVQAEAPLFQPGVRAVPQVIGAMLLEMRQFDAPPVKNQRTSAPASDSERRGSSPKLKCSSQRSVEERVFACGQCFKEFPCASQVRTTVIC